MGDSKRWRRPSENFGAMAVCWSGRGVEPRPDHRSKGDNTEAPGFGKASLKQLFDGVADESPTFQIELAEFINHRRLTRPKHLPQEHHHTTLRPSFGQSY